MWGQPPRAVHAARKYRAAGTDHADQILLRQKQISATKLTDPPGTPHRAFLRPAYKARHPSDDATTWRARFSYDGGRHGLMRIDELNETECREILSRTSSARLGCSLNDQPYVVPVGIAYEEDYIYIFSTMGQKIKWMRSNPKVCVQIDEIKSQSDWISVIANGEYQELPEPQFEHERAHAHALLQKRHHWWLNAMAERRIRLRDEEIKPLFFRIRVSSVTGLRGAEGE